MSIFNAFKNPPKFRRAFTFVELIIVVLIVGAIIGVAIPQFTKLFSNIELTNFVKDIYYLSTYLGESATLKNKVYCLNINRDEAPPQIYATYKKVIQETETWVKLEGRYGKVYKVPKGVTIFSQEPPDKNNIYFYPDGSSDAVTIIFQNKLKEQSSLLIKGATGEIQVK